MTGQLPRILFLDQFGGMGGGQRILQSLVRAAIAEFGTAAVMAPGGGALEKSLRQEFGDCVKFYACEEPRLSYGRKTPADIPRALSYGWRFRKQMAVLRAQDVIYVNGVRHLPHLLIYRNRRSRLIVHVHLDHSLLEKALVRIASWLACTFRVVTASSFIAERLRTPARKTILIENALDPSFAGRAFVDRFSQSPPNRAAVIGTIRPEKGQDIAIAAAGDLELHLIGPEGDGAQEWIASLKRTVRQNVHYHGPVRNVAHEINKLGVQFNLVPSRWEEPFGLAAIEGMACSCITVVSGRGGLAEIAERTGAMVAADTEALRATLARLASTPGGDLKVIAQQQYTATQTTYSPVLFTDKIRTLLRAALAA